MTMEVTVLKKIITLLCTLFCAFLASPVRVWAAEGSGGGGASDSAGMALHSLRRTASLYCSAASCEKANGGTPISLMW